MKKILSGNYYKVFLIRLLYVFLLFSLTRILFYLFNYDSFRELGIGDFFLLLIYGLRFDFSAIIIFYSLFIFLTFLPFHLKHKKFFQKILLIIFTVSTALSLAANLLDCGYFTFTLSRSTSDIFNVLGLGSDFSSLISQYIFDFWYLFLIWIFLITVTVWFFNNTKVIERTPVIRKNIILVYFKELIILIFVSAIGLVGIRGGLQLRPIGIITAGQYTSAKNISIVLNTPFTIYRTLGKTGLKDVEYFDNNKLTKIFSPVRNYYKKNRREKFNNVIVIILESFSKEYIGSLNKSLDNGNYKGYTPFLDSLINESLYFTQAYANGKRSIEAIPAIVSSVPSLMNEAYITSMYSTNAVNSIASLLKTKGYSSAFFHGGTNGTMGFDEFIDVAGFDRYYGRTEYNNEKDFDGKWGIADEEYLHYVSGMIDKMPKPFIAGIFTLSSHHPYTVPAKYTDKFTKGKLPIHQSIGYTDYALKQFFHTISSKPWFDSTLFVITADHTSESMYPQYQTRTGMYAIPLLFYQHSSQLKGDNNQITQQDDILPSVLDYLNYNGSFIAYGESVFDSSSVHFAINYVNESYQFIYKNYSLIFDGISGIYLYNLRNDSLMKKNIADDQPVLSNEMLEKTKAIIQSYNQRLIKNNMVLKK